MNPTDADDISVTLYPYLRTSDCALLEGYATRHDKLAFPRKDAETVGGSTNAFGLLQRQSAGGTGSGLEPRCTLFEQGGSMETGLGRHAPDGIADVVGHEQGTMAVDGHSDGPPLRFAVGVKESSQHVLRPA